jgi:hypothetical protein
MVKCCCRELTATHLSALVECYMPLQKDKNSLKIPKGQPESVQLHFKDTNIYRTRYVYLYLIFTVTVHLLHWHLTPSTVALNRHSGASGRVSSSCSTSDTRRVTLVTNPVISHE